MAGRIIRGGTAVQKDTCAAWTYERRAWWTAASAVVLVGFGLRVAGAWGELWFDEIWTLNLVTGRAPTPLHMFWTVRHVNVHPLYGFYA